MTLFSVFGRRERWRRESLAGAEGSLERKGGVACTCPSHVPLLTWCQGEVVVVVPVRRRRPWVFPRGIRSHGVASTAVSTAMLCNTPPPPAPPIPHQHSTLHFFFHVEVDDSLGEETLRAENSSRLGANGKEATVECEPVEAGGGGGG